jgi:hypothetical protein
LQVKIIEVDVSVPINGHRNANGQVEFIVWTNNSLHITKGPSSADDPDRPEFVIIHKPLERLVENSTYTKILANLQKIPRRLNPVLQRQKLPQVNILHASELQKFFDTTGPVCVLIPEVHAYDHNMDSIWHAGFTNGEILKSNQQLLARILQDNNSFSHEGFYEGYIPQHLIAQSNNQFKDIYQVHRVPSKAAERRFDYTLFGVNEYILDLLVSGKSVVDMKFDLSYYTENNKVDIEACNADIQRAVAELGLSDFVAYKEVETEYGTRLLMPYLARLTNNESRENLYDKYIEISRDYLAAIRDSGIAETIKFSSAKLVTMVVGAAHSNNLIKLLEAKGVPVVVIGNEGLGTQDYQASSQTQDDLAEAWKSSQAWLQEVIKNNN